MSYMFFSFNFIDFNEFGNIAGELIVIAILIREHLQEEVFSSMNMNLLEWYLFSNFLIYFNL